MEGVGWVIGVGGWEARGRLWDCLEHLRVQEVLVIGPDKPRGPKRCLTNTGVNIRPIPPI